MKPVKKILALAMAAVLLFITTVPAFAQNEASEKEEVIYINLAADGSVKEVYAVNIFGKGDITDYGDYSSVELLNTTGEISQSGDRITFSTDADRVYYQGKLTDPVIPWDISIRYFIDGIEYSAKDAAGKSGRLEIRFQVTENTSAVGNFFDSYALQASFTLDTVKCTNIRAANATLANVGGKKQISYTILPGSGIDATITADVVDFEMDAVSINGVPLSMEIDVDDEELMQQVRELLDAIAALDDGAGVLQNGVSALQSAAQTELQSGIRDFTDGTDQLYSGAGALKSGGEALGAATDELKDGAAKLQEGADQLHSGAARIQQGLDTLAAGSPALVSGSADVLQALGDIQAALDGVSASTEQIDALVAGSSQIKSAIGELSYAAESLQGNVSFDAYKAAMLQNGLDIDYLQAGNSQAISLLTGQIDTLNQTAAALESAGSDPAQAAQLREQADALQSVVACLQGDMAAIGALDTYFSQLNGSIGLLADGVSSLQNHYDALDEGIRDMAEEVDSLLANLSVLKNAIDTLASNYENLHSGIQEYTDGVAEIAAGYSTLVTGTQALLAGSNALKTGTDTLNSKTYALLSGIEELYNAAGALTDGSGRLDAGVAELLAGIAELYHGSADMKEGTAEMRAETDGMEDEISNKIDEMLQLVTGDGSDTVSFVSEKNTHVDSVQFVIQTEAVKAAEAPAPVEEPEEPLSFWQKILRLFGWD